MASNPEPAREQEGMALVAAIRTALPTSRHAGMVVDAVVSMLGDDAVVETADEGRLLLLYRRDAEHPDWIVPWPILRFSQGKRLSYVIGAEGPPTNEAPPPRDAQPLRLGGLTPGELEVSDGRFRISATFGQDGRVAETSRGGSLENFMSLVGAVARGNRNPAEVLIDNVMALDPAQAGPGRLLRPLPSPANVEGTWVCRLGSIRDAMLDGLVPGSARWVAADGYAGTVICAGATRADVIEECRKEILRLKPRPPEPEPPPTLSPETLAEMGMEGQPFIITTPALDGPRVEPSPENTPILLLPLAPLPAAPPPFGEWLRLIDDRGVSSHAVLQRDENGVTVMGAAWAQLIDSAGLDAMLDAAERDAAPRFDGFIRHAWPSGLPRLNSLTLTLVLDETAPGTVHADVRGCSHTHGFGGHAFRPEVVTSGVMRQRWLD